MYLDKLHMAAMHPSPPVKNAESGATLSTPPETSSALQGLATRSLFVVFVVHRRWRRSNSRLLELLLLRIRGGVQRLLLDRRLGDRRPLGLIRFFQVYAR